MQQLFLNNIADDDVLVTTRTWLETAQCDARSNFERTQDVACLTFTLSSIIDHMIVGLCGYFSQDRTIPLSIIATGGYGRREQCPYSDIDLLFLYEKKNRKLAAKLVESLLYVLWDLGLKVGQAHRHVEETLQLAEQDIHVRTSLLDARLVAGDYALFATLMQRLQTQVIEDSALSFVEAKLAERDIRHSRFGDSRYMLEPNIKEGKGGLRDLHTLWWLARYVYHVESLDDLVDLHHLTPEELSTFRQANAFLLRTRAHLHYISGHADERLSFDKQLAVAQAMGYRNESPNLAITRFMRRYFIAVRTVGSLTRIFCALLEDEKKRKPRKPLGWITLAAEQPDYFELDGERLSIIDDDVFSTHPIAMLQLFSVAQERELDIHPRALRAITRNLHLIDDVFRKDATNNSIFLHILQSDKGPQITLSRMNEAGILGRFIPEFGRIIGQTQFNMYHIYTVDEHTLVALGILHSIDVGKVADEAPLATSIMTRITQKHVLYLSLFCHDIAKGRGGDHSELGEIIVIKLGKRFGFTSEECETAAWLVRNHLLLSSTAFKRDLNDPKTIADFVALVRTPERLKLLLVLTVADIRAVAPAVWNEWKGALMRDLFNRSMHAMGSSELPSTDGDTENLKQTLEKILPSVGDKQISYYLALGSSGFLSGCSINQHIAIARMLLVDPASTHTLKTNISHDEKRCVTEIIISTEDKKGLFATLSGAITLAGATIISAKIFTLKDGRAVDIFQIQDMAGNAFNRPSMLAKMAVYIEQSLSGKLNLSESLLHRAQSYKKNAPTVMREGSVFVENDASSTSTVIEITAHDRLGLLYDVAHTLTTLGLSIVTAHISTYGNQAADVFYVKDNFGMKIHHEGKIKAIRETISKVL